MIIKVTDSKVSRYDKELGSNKGSKQLKPSPKMKKAIKYIEKALDIKFTGTSMQEASDFISKNLDKSRKVDIRTKLEPSPKMLKALDLIEDNLDVVYEGSSMKDASDFISKYLEQALGKIHSKGGK